MRTGNIEIAGKKLTPHSVTTAERDALGIPAMGTVVYNSTTGYLEYWRGTGAGWTKCTEDNHLVLAEAGGAIGYVNDFVRPGTGIQTTSFSTGTVISTNLQPGDGISIVYPTSGVDSGKAIIINTGLPSQDILPGIGIGVTPTPAGLAVYLLEPPTAPVCFSAARAKVIALGPPESQIPAVLKGWFYVSDPGNAFNETTGVYTVPESGYYSFSGSVSLECISSTISAIEVPFGIYSNSSAVLSNLGHYSVKNHIINECPIFSVTREFHCTAGDQVSFRIYYPSGYLALPLYHQTSFQAWESFFAGHKIK